MTMTAIHRATRFTAVCALLRASSDVADHWIQIDHQAATKAQQDDVAG